ncbi:hypothetical protein HPP92_014221 [Vanilla planifolia]|uniref:Uncharacterized protein n=1 Tax=Vanilla planifolia TaxID=51239 RepID=A0A835QPV4_VANPL|nr:hypothetical protein HPP92_014221 [Vanilla planifolia]
MGAKLHEALLAKPKFLAKFEDEPNRQLVKHFDYTRHNGCQLLLKELDVGEKSGLDHLKLLGDGGDGEAGEEEVEEGGDVTTLVIEKQDAIRHNNGTDGAKVEERMLPHEERGENL